MSLNIRPLTKRMLQKLRDCSEKEIKSNGANPCLQEDLKGSLSGLYKRGLVSTKVAEVNGKKLLCLFITDEGKRFLKNTLDK